MQWPPRKTFLQAVGKILPKPCMASSLCNPLPLCIQKQQWRCHNIQVQGQLLMHDEYYPMSVITCCLPPESLQLFGARVALFFWFVQDLVESWARSITTLNTKNKVSLVSMLRSGSNDTRWCKASFSENRSKMYRSFAITFSEAIA